jgi:flagellar protein FliO/FliZ
MIELTLRIAFSLLVVLGLMWLLAKVIRRPLAGRAQGVLAVLGRQQLSRNAHVAVLKVGDRALVLGVTDQQVTLLAETDPHAMATPVGGELRVPVSLDELDASGPLAGSASAGSALAGSALAGSALAGSALSPSTWKQAASALRGRGRDR